MTELLPNKSKLVAQTNSGEFIEILQNFLKKERYDLFATMEMYSRLIPHLDILQGY